MGRNCCGTAAELVMGPASSQTQHVLSTVLAKGRHKLFLEVLPYGTLAPRGSKLLGCPVS